MMGRSPAARALVAFVDNEPEWAIPALVSYFERFTAGDKGEASAQKWRDERAAAEVAHLAKTA